MSLDLNAVCVICRHLEEPLPVTDLFKRCQRAGLHASFKVFKKHLKVLQQSGAVELVLLPTVSPCGRGLVIVQDKHRKFFGRPAWHLTEKGQVLLRRFEEIAALLEDEGLPDPAGPQALQVCT